MSEAWPPEHAELLVSFEVAGEPKGAGSKNAIPLGRWITEDGRRRFKAVYRDGGVPVVNIVDTAGKAGEAWSEEIRAACARALDASHALADGPIAVRVTFYGDSPKSRYGTGRNAEKLKEHADRLPHRSELADGTKLARRLEDALNGLCWTDDRRVCELWWSRRFGQNPGAKVEVYALPARFCDVPGEFEAVASPDQLVILPAYGHDGDSGGQGGGDRGAVDRGPADRGVGGREVDSGEAAELQT